MRNPRTRVKVNCKSHPSTPFNGIVGVKVAERTGMDCSQYLVFFDEPAVILWGEIPRVEVAGWFKDLDLEDIS